MEITRQPLIPVTLKGGNYLLWSRTVKTALCSRGLWNHIDGTRPEDEGSTPEASTEGRKWFQEDQTVLAIIQSSLEASVLAAYSYCDSAKELWETLKNVFGNISNISRIFEVKKAISNLQQEEEFTKHFGDFRALWAELEELRPLTVDPKELQERHDQDQVFALLLTLKPANYDLIKHILRADKLPTLNEVCMQIQREEGSQGLFGRKGGLVLANQTQFRRNNRRGPAQVCKHCEKPGHSQAQCWVLHPHKRPEWYDPEKATPKKWTSRPDTGRAMATTAEAEPADNLVQTVSKDEVLKKSDLEALIESVSGHSNPGMALKAFFKKPIIIDSGASHHMISDSNLITNVESTRGNVVIANGNSIPVSGTGNLKVCQKESSALYVPDFTSNLLSVRKITNDLNCLAIFGPNSMRFQDIKTGDTLGEGTVKDGLYILNQSGFALASKLTSNVWHDRLGHPHQQVLRILFPNEINENHLCDSCTLGKHCRTVFPNSNTIYKNCFDLIHSDVWTAPCLSRDNMRYFVSFIDEKSKYTWITLLPNKGRVFEAFSNFCRHVETQYGAKIKILRTDNGGEYMSNEFKTFTANKGIIHQTSCPYTPQQNGVAERKNRHLMEVTRTMMFHKAVPKRFWGDAVITATYLINRLPTVCLQDKTPYEVLNREKPSLDHLRTFGCVCFPLLTEDKRNKLEARSVRCIFIGYPPNQKGYRCYNPSTNQVYTSRDVKFNEAQSFYEDKDWGQIKEVGIKQSDRAATLRFILEGLESIRGGQNNKTTQNGPEGVQEGLPEPDQEGPDAAEAEGEPEYMSEEMENPDAAEAEGEPEQDVDEPHDDLDEVLEEDEDTETGSRQPTVPRRSPRLNKKGLRRSERLKKVPTIYYNHKAVAHPIQAACSMAHVPADHQAFLGEIDKGLIPRTYEEAIQKKEWLDAIKEEISAMKRNNTWTKEELPKGKRPVTSRWVFTIKYKSNGEVERYKARLVARGFTQTYGVDYNETFAPVAKLHTVRVVLSTAVNRDWSLWQMDVKNAFLQGELEEEVYMRPPPGLDEEQSTGRVLKLRKAIYGLKQSPRAWYHKLSLKLIQKGFSKSQADHSLFTSQGNEGIVVVLVYVDDLIITGDDRSGIEDTKSYLKSHFDIKDLGILKYFLGIEVCRTDNGLFLSQRKYSLDLLSETGKLGAKPVRTPIEANYKDTRKGELEEEPFQDIHQYMRVVGRLIYLTITRPDISFAVNQVSQHMKAPTVHHWHMVERILKYIKGAPGKGIWMGKNANTNVTGYCDADWAGDKTDRKSTTGFCTFIGGNLVTWRSKKQKVVARSSAEAEYRAMADTTDELTWLRALLIDLGQQPQLPITLHCDNQAAIHIASNSVFHERTKHIEVDCHHIREKVEMGLVLPTFTKSQDQLADIFTKGTNSRICKMIHGKLSLLDLHTP